MNLSAMLFTSNFHLQNYTISCLMSSIHLSYWNKYKFYRWTWKSI